MKEISVVIICRNEEKLIGNTIQSVRQLTDDIVCVDNGSTDQTREIIQQNGGKLVETKWEGYGRTKNKGIAAARYDWILSLDADEPIDQVLLNSLESEPLEDPLTAYNVHRKTFFGAKEIRFGEWGRTDKRLRVFNRKTISWNDARVHEELILPGNLKIGNLKGWIFHRTSENVADLAFKTVQYAMLSAEKYQEQQKRAKWFNLYVSPYFSFLRYYIFRLGLLDGWEGYLIARMNAHYIFLKYARLKELNNTQKK